MKDFTQLEKKLGYEFKNKALLKEALTHKSILSISPKTRLEKSPAQNKAHKNEDKKTRSLKIHSPNNERLEFLGDAVLDLIVGEFLFFKFKSHSEGELSKLRAALVNEKSFAKIALNLDLGKYIFMSNAEENNEGRNKPSILSDAFESVIAAIYLEAGFDRAKSIALSLFEANFPHIDAAHLIKDYKTKLQEYTQATLAQAPEYETLRAFGPDHKKSFEVALKLDGKEFARAIANSKKEAQQMAAKITLERLNFE
ncbi:ribonuclease III [Campylobacter troglodytis]|uniref:ribonuclease III n=1 Tax=Campylobacter troglodytis TaxID=654363 RepID=UPI00115C05D7|nr:ribonuclease III [Campylobacter troglodytis]TQR58182.1 ribonuclease III [Campylobacter troglodytis]